MRGSKSGNCLCNQGCYKKHSHRQLPRMWEHNSGWPDICNEQQNRKSFSLAQERYAALGVGVDHALKTLVTIPISLHCWQGDDVVGFENFAGALGNGLAGSSVKRSSLIIRMWLIIAANIEWRPWWRCSRSNQNNLRDVCLARQASPQTATQNPSNKRN